MRSCEKWNFRRPLLVTFSVFIARQCNKIFITGERNKIDMKAMFINLNSIRCYATVQRLSLATKMSHNKLLKQVRNSVTQNIIAI